LVTLNNATWTVNGTGTGTMNPFTHLFWDAASVINGWTVNGTQAQNVTLNMSPTPFKITGFSGPCILTGALGNATTTVPLDTYTYTGPLASLKTTLGRQSKWSFLDAARSDGAVFRWDAGATPTGDTGFYGVLHFRPSVNVSGDGYAPQARLTPSALASRYPVKTFSTTANSTIALSNFYQDSTMSGSDGALPFVDSLDDKTVLSIINWTMDFRQPGFLDQQRVFAGATALKGAVTYAASGVADGLYVNASTAAADLALISINTTTKTIAPVTGTLVWNPQRLYNAIKQWWATYASDNNFVAATGGGILDLGDYNVAAGLSFATAQSGDALDRVRTTGVISAPTNQIPVQDAGGVSSILQVQAIKPGASYVVMNNATKETLLFGVNNTATIQTYQVYFPTGSSGLQVYAARQFYGDQFDFAVVTLQPGVMFVGFNDIPDEGISEPNIATVQAYTTIENTNKLYDSVAAYRTTEAGLKLGSIVNRAGPLLQFGNFSGLVKQNAASVFSITGDTITLKANGLIGTSKYTTIIATPPATWEADTTELLDLDLEDANGNSSVDIQASGNNQFEIWKIADAVSPDDYATGTLLDTVGIGKYRFLSANGFKMVIRDTTTNFRVVVEMEKGIYLAELFFGGAVQLAQSPDVTIIKNNLALMQVDIDAMKGAGFESSTDSLNALGSNTFAGVAQQDTLLLTLAAAQDAADLSA